MSSRHDAYIGLGANLGARKQSIHRALDAIDDLPQVELVDVSNMYETNACFVEEQPDFINACAHLKTSLSALGLLQQLLAIEQSMGRVRDVHQGPRVIDLDLLFYADQIIDEEGLSVPHPDLHNRDFVLRPMVDIAPEVVHPVLQKSVKQIWDERRKRRA